MILIFPDLGKSPFVRPLKLKQSIRKQKKAEFPIHRYLYLISNSFSIFAEILKVASGIEMENFQNFSFLDVCRPGLTCLTSCSTTVLRPDTARISRQQMFVIQKNLGNYSQQIQTTCMKITLIAQLFSEYRLK